MPEGDGREVVKRKKMKPVRAWAIRRNDGLYSWALHSRAAVLSQMGGILEGDERIVRVEIREAPKRRKAVRK